MVSAGVIPSARDQREFTLMGQEKMEAAAESMQAMAMQALHMNQQMGMLAYRQMMSGAIGLLSAASTMAPFSSGQQTKLLRDTLANSTEAMSHLSGATARLAHHGLKPIHTRARGNAKRLGALKK